MYDDLLVYSACFAYSSWGSSSGMRASKLKSTDGISDISIFVEKIYIKRDS